ncbi:MAG: serine/threonine protein kinase [Candidatus Sericytochromatia bacterium]|nr:serine/threonine protein kinase [Candidatus Sericytochromatia bacterium]
MINVGECLNGENGQYSVKCLLHLSPQLITAEAQNTETGQTVVLKELSLDKLLSWKVLELFEREMATLRQLNHPHLPTYLDTFQRETDKETYLYLVCTWAEGQSLQAALESGWKPDAQEIRQIAQQILGLLVHLHSFNPPIIHRDIKPGNLILDSQDQIHLVDLGSVQGVLNPDGGSTVVGTFGYMPPEQFSGKTLPASDLYALGATLLHLLTGKDPAELPRKGMKIQFPPELQLDKSLKNWLDQLLAPEVENRYQTATQALDALEQGNDLSSSNKGPRLLVQARGTGLKLTFNRPGFQKILGTKGYLGGSLILFWLYYQVLGLFVYSPDLKVLIFSQDPITAQFFWIIYWLAQTPFFVLLGGFIVGVRLVLSQIITQIQVQPDRFQIISRWHKFKWETEGATSELNSIRSRFNFLTMTETLYLGEKTQIEHEGPLFCSTAEAREMTEYLYQYLLADNPEQAESLIQNSLVSPHSRRQKITKLLIVNQRQMRVFLAWAYHLVWKKSIGIIPFQSLRQRLHSLNTWSRISFGASHTDLKINIAPKKTALIWDFCLFFPLLISPVYFLFWVNTFYFNRTSVNHIRMTMEFQSWGDIYTYGLYITVIFLACFPISIYAFRYLFFKLSTGLFQTEIVLQPDKIKISNFLFGFVKTSELKMANLVDFHRVAILGSSRSNDLILSEKGGKQTTLAYTLSLEDTQWILKSLAEYFKFTPTIAHPLFKSVLAQTAKDFQFYPDLEMTRKNRIQSQTGENHILIQISAMDLQWQMKKPFFAGAFFLAAGFVARTLVEYQSNLTFIQDPIGFFGLKHDIFSVLLQTYSFALWGLGLWCFLRIFYWACLKTVIQLGADSTRFTYQFLNKKWHRQIELQDLQLTPLETGTGLIARDKSGKTYPLGYGLTPAETNTLCEEISLFNRTQELEIPLLNQVPVQGKKSLNPWHQAPGLK